MTKQEVETRLTNDWEFGLAFASANQPQLLASSLQSKGIPVNSTAPEDVYNVLRGLVMNGKGQLILEMFKSIPYNSQPSPGNEWTAGYEQYFKINTPVSTSQLKGFSISGLLSGIGAGLSAYASASATQQTQPGATQPVLTEAQKKALEEEEKKRLEEEAKAKRKKWLIGGGLALVFLIIIIVVVSQNKKQKQNGN